MPRPEPPFLAVPPALLATWHGLQARSAAALHETLRPDPADPGGATPERPTGLEPAGSARGSALAVGATLAADGPSCGGPAPPPATAREAASSLEPARLALGATVAVRELEPAGGALRPGGARRPLGAARGWGESLPRIALEADDAAPRPGDFRLLRTLGEGGMGRVYLAVQPALEREVALKVPHRADDPDARQALGEEAIVLARVEHPNVVPVHLIALDERGRMVLVMKKIDGVEWRALLREPDHPRWAELGIGPDEREAFHLDVLTQVANALHAAHARAVIHRDLKPENVMIGRFGEVYLVDWGVAARLDRADSAGAAGDRGLGIVGTPAYLAPELAGGEPAAHGIHTDVFGLGATLFEVLTGRPPWAGESLVEVLALAWTCPPLELPAELPNDLAALVRAATAREPAERPASALEFRRALDRHRRHRASIAIERRARVKLEQAQAEGAGAGLGVDRALSEARFGFEQALAEWPGNERARAGLRAALGLVATLEGRRGDLAGMTAAVDELVALGGDESGHFAAELERLRVRLGEREAKIEAHERDRHERDLRVGARERAIAVGVLAVVSLLFSGGILTSALGGGAPISDTGQLVALAGGFLALLGSALFIGRRLAFANAANRRFTALFGLVFVGLFAHRLLAWQVGLDWQRTLVFDQLCLALICAAGALTIPRLGWIVLPWLVGACVGALRPDWAMYGFSAGAAGSFVLVAAQWRAVMADGVR